MIDWLDYQLWPGPYLEQDYIWHDCGDGRKIRDIDKSNVSTVTLLTVDKVERNLHYRPGDIYFTWHPEVGWYPAGFVVTTRLFYMNCLGIDVQWNDNY